MFQELGAWSLKRKMANSTDFNVTFFGASAWAAATHGRKRHASMAMRVNCLAKLGIFTLRYHTSATGCSAPTRGNPSSPELFSCLAYMESLWRSVRQVSPLVKPRPWTEPCESFITNQIIGTTEHFEDECTAVYSRAWHKAAGPSR